jgi:hypothetical protein
MGVIRRVERPSFEEQIYEQVDRAKKKFRPDLKKLIYSSDVWEVK